MKKLEDLRLSRNMKYEALYWALGYVSLDNSIFKKEYNGITITIDSIQQFVDFENKISVINADKLMLTTHKSFVVLECIDKLLSMGYKASEIIIDCDNEYDIYLKDLYIKCFEWNQAKKDSVSFNKDTFKSITYESRLVSGIIERRTSIRDYQGNVYNCGIFENEKKLDELIAQRQDDINQFFTIAGFPYNFCLEKDGEKHAKAYLVPCEFQKEMVVDPKNRLSWGEKNAFSLVMFMFEAISDNADLIVLDDPISAFDEKKKFGIIRRLFDNKKDSFKEKTVLMLTHDFQPIIDYVHGNFFTRYGLITPVHASFIQNIEGSICESPITMNDLKNTVELTKDIVMSSNASMAVKIVNLRKYVELTKPEFGTSAIYEVLSNVIHGRQNPIYKDGQEISADVLEQGMREVSQYIPNKSYTDLINGTSTEILISSMSSDDLYHRIISIRLLFERVEGTLSLLRKKYPAACKFVNETNHVENDYIYQLDPRKYFGIPNYYLQQIENFIQENKETILAGNILTENTELDQIGDN